MTIRLAVARLKQLRDSMSLEGERIERRSTTMTNLLATFVEFGVGVKLIVAQHRASVGAIVRAAIALLLASHQRCNIDLSNPLSTQSRMMCVRSHLLIVVGKVSQSLACLPIVRLCRFRFAHTNRRR